MFGMLFNGTLGADGVGTSLAVGVNFGTDVLQAAGNPLHGGISGQGFLKGDLLVSRSHLPPFVNTRTRGADMLVAVNTVHCGILVIASLTFDHPVDVSPIGLRGLNQGVDEGVAGVGPNSAGSWRGKGSSTPVAAEVRQLGLGSELLGLKTTKTERVQAGKGAGVVEGLVAHRALRQLVDWKVEQRRTKKVSERVLLVVDGRGRMRGHTGKGVLLGNEGGDEGILLFLGWERQERCLATDKEVTTAGGGTIVAGGLKSRKVRYSSLVSFGGVDTGKSDGGRKREIEIQ